MVWKILFQANLVVTVSVENKYLDWDIFLNFLLSILFTNRNIYLRIIFIYHNIGWHNATRTTKPLCQKASDYSEWEYQFTEC